MLVRDWLFTGTSQKSPGGLVSVGYPPVNEECFDWLGLMAAVLSADSRFTMVEIGAGWGRWLVAGAKLARQRGIPCRLLGVEADADHFRWMLEVFRDNALGSDECQLCSGAVAPEDGPAFLLRHERPEQNYGQHLVDPASFPVQNHPGHYIAEVNAKSLRSILHPLDCVDFLRCDVGGAEDEILSSASTELDRVRILQISTRKATDERLHAWLQDMGWINVFRFPPETTAETPYGPVAFGEGLQTWLHPRAAGVRELFEPIYPMAYIPDVLPAGGGGVSVFDTEAARHINDARMSHLASLGLPIEGRSVLDVGCGVGHLAQFFVQKCCDVVCVDAREENILSLRSRYPGLSAHVLNVETDSLDRLGRFDVVFCYGLLYHLENPVAALRNIASACSELLLLETMVLDHPEPLLRIVDEPSATLSQTVASLGSRPTPSFVTMALNRIGFPFVYAPRTPPQHPDFRFQWKADLSYIREEQALRCIFIASRHGLDNPNLVPLIQNDRTAAAIV